MAAAAAVAASLPAGLTGFAEMVRMSVNSVSAGASAVGGRGHASTIFARFRIEREGMKRWAGTGAVVAASALAATAEGVSMTMAEAVGVGLRGRGFGGVSEDSAEGWASTGGVSLAFLGCSSGGAGAGDGGTTATGSCGGSLGGIGDSGAPCRRQGVNGVSTASLGSKRGGGAGEGSSTRGRDSGGFGAITAPLKCELRMRVAGRPRVRRRLGRGRSGRGADGGRGMNGPDGAKGSSGVFGVA